MHSDRAALLADSELHYEMSGGFAGFASGATLEASGGTITVEHWPERSRPGTPPETGTLPESDYLDLWAEAERAGIWTLEGKPSPKGADFITYALRARVGRRALTFRWTEEETTPSATTAGRIGRGILEAARRAVAPER